MKTALFHLTISGFPTRFPCTTSTILHPLTKANIISRSLRLQGLQPDLIMVDVNPPPLVITPAFVFALLPALANPAPMSGGLQLK